MIDKMWEEVLFPCARALLFAVIAKYNLQIKKEDLSSNSFNVN